MEDKAWQDRKALKESLDQLRREFSWHRHYAEHFFSKAAVEKYPDESERESRLWEYHEKQVIRGYNGFSFWTLAAPDQELKAHRDYMSGLREVFGERAWSHILDEKDHFDTYRGFADRAGTDLKAFFDKLDERPSDYARLRALPDSPVIRAERQLDAMTRTAEGQRNLAGSDSPRLLTLEMAIDWNGVNPEEKDSVLARVVDFGKLRPHLRADIAETARRLWDHSETRRVGLTERGEGDRWKPIGFVALSDELRRVIDERKSHTSGDHDRDPTPAGHLTTAGPRETWPSEIAKANRLKQTGQEQGKSGGKEKADGHDDGHSM